jgi:hypothetical protein
MAMLHGDEFGRPDWILMLVAPPVAGCAAGLLLSLRRRRSSLAAIGGSVGGTVGAWLGVGLYRWVMNEVIGGRDIKVFAATAFGSFLLGAISLGWACSGPKTLRTSHIGGPGYALQLGAAYWQP